jgi:hypothetical protein
VQLVIGAGEVGTAIAEVLRSAHGVGVRDLAPLQVQADVIHIAFRWNEQFVEQVKQYEREHQADLVIIHSTVPVGTCDPRDWVHSPVRGRHPDLGRSLLAFRKHFGGHRAEEAATIFGLCGVVTSTHPNAIETEAGKLWELVQYGQQIVTEKCIHQWCKENGADFDVVYRLFAESYNEGYEILEEDWAVRPVLEHMPGPVGGHCVVPGAKLLDHYLAKEVVTGSFVLGENELEEK